MGGTHHSSHHHAAVWRLLCTNRSRRKQRPVMIRSSFDPSFIFVFWLVGWLVGWLVRLLVGWLLAGCTYRCGRRYSVPYLLRRWVYSMPLSNASVAMTGKQVLDARRWSNDAFTKHRHFLLGLSADWSQTHSCPLGSVNASCFVFTVFASGGLGGWGAASTAVSDPRRKHSTQVAWEEPATVRQGTDMTKSQKMEHTPTPSTGSTINYHNQL